MIKFISKSYQPAQPMQYVWAYSPWVHLGFEIN